MRLASIMLILLLIISGNAIAAEKKKSGKKGVVKSQEVKPLPSAPVSQGEFARELIRVFGWENGIPRVVIDPKRSKEFAYDEEEREPTDRDYLVILNGKRTLRFEAEDIFSRKRDRLSVRNYDLFGPFTGKSWLGGVSSPVTVHFKTFIPFDGVYQISAAAKGDGQIWTIEGKEYRVNSGGRLTLTKVTTVPLKAGWLRFEMIMPPEGGIDHIVFTAPDYSPIEPLGGWRFSEPLTNSELAEITASLLGWEEQLPVNEKGITRIPAFELPGLPSSVNLTDSGILGTFNAKKWLRAGAQGADIEIPITLKESGVYGLKINAVGEPFKAVLDGVPLLRPGKPYFDWVDLGLHRLSAGSHTLQLSIPLYGGVDTLIIEPRQSDPAAYLKLVGISGDPRAVVIHAEKEKILTKLVERFTARK